MIGNKNGSIISFRMSAQFFPYNLAGHSAATENDPQQHFNLLLQAILLMKTRNETNASDLNAILEPILKGHHAIPIHLKILLERIVENLDADEVQRVLKETGWTIDDLKRGYVLVVSFNCHYFLKNMFLGFVNRSAPALLSYCKYSNRTHYFSNDCRYFSTFEDWHRELTSIIVAVVGCCSDTFIN